MKCSFKNKKGISGLFIGIFIGVIIVGLGYLIFSYLGTTSLFQGEPKDFFSQFLSSAFNSLKNIFNSLPGSSLVKDILGLNEGLPEFGEDLIVGAMTGLWLWGVFLIARLEFFGIGKIITHLTNKGVDLGLENKPLTGTWLEVIGGNWWKIIPIAFTYAVISQIPIVTSVLKVITFEVLLNYKDGLWGDILRSFILAFYIGFLPTAIEEYRKYKIRVALYGKVEGARANKAIENL